MSVAPQLLRIRDAAARLAVDPSTVRRYVAQGELRKVRKPRGRVYEDDVHALLARNTADGPAPAVPGDRPLTPGGARELARLEALIRRRARRAAGGRG